MTQAVGVSGGKLDAFAPGIWLVAYSVPYFGMEIPARMTVIQMSDGRVMLHSPCALSEALKSAIDAIGPVAWIVAPGTFHHVHVPAAQAAYPTAKTWLCPGLERKRPELTFDGILDDQAPVDWADDLEQVPVRGTGFMAEVAFYHRASRVLILVDLIELIGDQTPGIGWTLRLWWGLFRMWNRPRPAPEYRMGWRDKRAAARGLRDILAWDFERIVIAHGDLITANAHEVAQDAWASVLRAH